jgi:hypothetical protein
VLPVGHVDVEHPDPGPVAGGDTDAVALVEAGVPRSDGVEVVGGGVLTP